MESLQSRAKSARNIDEHTPGQFMMLFAVQNSMGEGVGCDFSGVGPGQKSVWHRERGETVACHPIEK
jgi:hypothetical protein